MKVFLLFFVCIFISAQSLIAQTNPRFVLPEYCRADSAKSATVTGRLVKIKNVEGVYEDLNTNPKIKWFSDGIRIRAGKDGWGAFRPKTGDTGKVVTVIYKKDEAKKRRYVYVLYVHGYFVPVNGWYVTDLDKSDDAHMAEWAALKNADYSKDGCKLKLLQVNGIYSNAGRDKIDSLSEGFACSLLAGGHDTVVLCKAYPSGANAVILWNDKGKGNAVVFTQNKRGKVSQGKPRTLAVEPVLHYFFENKLDTVTHAFKPEMQASMRDAGGLIVQVAMRDRLFRSEMPALIYNGSKNEPEAIWWKMVSDSLAKLLKE